MKYLVKRKTKEHQRMPADCSGVDWDAVDIVEADSEGWIKHTGKECPLPDDCMHEIKDREGDVYKDDHPDSWDWRKDGSKNDITHYRPILEKVQEPEIPEPPECRWPDCACERHDCFDFEMPETSVLDRLKAAHAHAQQIPDLEAELRELLGSMGYDLVSRNPFTQQRHGAGE